MTKNTLSAKRPFILAVSVLVLLSACSTMKFNTIPAPPQTAKLRVFVMALTENPQARNAKWQGTKEEFDNWVSSVVGKHLRGLDIYEVVPKQQIKAALGSQKPVHEEYWWARDDYALVKEFGKAARADYAVFVCRSWEVQPVVKMRIINIETGAKYETVLSTGRLPRNEGAEKILKMYGELFSRAKHDLLATAMRKGRLLPDEGEAPVDVAAAKPAPGGRETGPVKKTVSPPPRSPGKAPDGQPVEKARLVVYDFNSSGSLNVVSLILTEALRQEIFSQGGHNLVSRDNLLQIMEEMKIQKSGVVDEGQIVKLGKWLAASEAVTGRLAVVGRSYVLQVRRTDIQTMNTVGVGTARCEAGDEDKLLNSIPELARKVMGLKE